MAKAGQLRHIPAVKLCPKGVRPRGWHIFMHPNITEHESIYAVFAICPEKKNPVLKVTLLFGLLAGKYRVWFFKKYIPGPDL